MKAFEEPGGLVRQHIAAGHTTQPEGMTNLLVVKTHPNLNLMYLYLGLVHM